MKPVPLTDEIRAAIHAAVRKYGTMTEFGARANLHPSLLGKYADGRVDWISGRTAARLLPALSPWLKTSGGPRGKGSAAGLSTAGLRLARTFDLLSAASQRRVEQVLLDELAKSR